MFFMFQGRFRGFTFTMNLMVRGDYVAITYLLQTYDFIRQELKVTSGSQICR